MASRRQFSLRTRLLGGYAVVLATVVIGYGFLLAGVMALGASPRHIVIDHYASIQAAERMVQAVQEQQNAILRQLLNPDHPLEDSLAGADQRFRDWFAQARASVALMGERDVLESIDQRYALLQELIADRDRWASLYPWQPDVVDAFQNVIRACRQLAEINFDAMLVVSENAHEQVQSAVYAAGIAGFGTLLVSLLIALNVARRVSAPLHQIVEGTQRIARGDYQVQIPANTTRELDQLGRQFNAMAQSLQRFHDMNLERILLEQRQSEAVLRSIDDGLVIFGHDGHIRHLNPVAARQLRIDPGECQGRALGELLQTGDIDQEVRRCLGLADGSGDPGAGELTIDSVAGDRHLSYTVLPIIGDQPNRQGAVMVIRDITEHKAFEQLRNEFVMRASHELRTPVTSIRMGMGMLAEKSPFGPASRERELLDTVIEELDRLTRLVNDLFDLSRLQADRLPLEPDTCDPAELLESARQRFALEAEQHAVALRMELADDLPEVVIDPNQFARVLDNLLSNALHQTPTGGTLTLGARRRGQKLVIEVADTGSGIDYAHQRRIFEPFVQASESGRGAGLGLAICREIVQQHRGRITLHSVPGQGTTFRVELPL